MLNSRRRTVRENGTGTLENDKSIRRLLTTSLDTLDRADQLLTGLLSLGRTGGYWSEQFRPKHREQLPDLA